jgi:phosphoglycolate phosphatase-like HAD superfamily hydrolase
MKHRPTVIFDFDGTLADSMSVALEVCNAIAPEYGLRTLSDEEVGELRRLSSRESLRRLGVPLHLVPVLVRRVRNELSARIPSIELFAGMAECLEHLHGGGAELGVVTSNSKANVRRCLEHNGVSSLFEFVHTSTDLFGKHRALRRLLRRRALSAERVVYVGDQVRDIEAARKCRLRVIAVCWGFQSRSTLRKREPDLLAGTPADIEEYVLGRG